MIDRLILSRLESLSALLQVFQIFRGRSKARLCDLFRSAFAPLHKSHRLAKARIKVVAFVFLSVGLCQSRKDPYLPLEPRCVRLLPRPHGLAPYGICRQFSHPLSRTRKPPSNTIGQHTFARLGLITSAPSSLARQQCITDIFILKVYDGTHVILLLCFLCV